MFSIQQTNETPPALTNRRILLASNSPRRRELLTMIIPTFEIPPAVDINEIYPDSLPAPEVPVYLSKLKARAYQSTLSAPDDILITADTVVIVDGKIFGKPKDAQDAIRMLTTLSGRTHTVITGVTILTSGTTTSFSETTDVTFSKLSQEEIYTYVNHYRPFDKAGAYGIQEYIGAIGITGINGCFYNVMGLPVGSLYRKLKNLLRNND